GYDAELIANRLYAISSDARIIVTKREIHSFIISVYKQMVRAGYCGSFYDFLFARNWKTAGVSKDYFMQDSIIEVYKKLFHPDNVLILRFEDFKLNKIEFFNKIEKFLDIKLNGLEEQLDKIVGKALPNKRVKALRLLNRLRRT